MEKNIRGFSNFYAGEPITATLPPPPQKKVKKKKKEEEEDKRGETRLLYTYLYTSLYFQRSSEMVMYKPQKFVLPRTLFT